MCVREINQKEETITQHAAYASKKCGTISINFNSNKPKKKLQNIKTKRVYERREQRAVVVSLCCITFHLTIDPKHNSFDVRALEIWKKSQTAKKSTFEGKNVQNELYLL